jgi:hypothetical protein
MHALGVVALSVVAAVGGCAQEDEGGDGELRERYVAALAEVESQQDSPISGHEECYGEAMVDAIGVARLAAAVTPEEIEEAGEFDPVGAGIDVTEEDAAALYDGVSECVDMRPFLVDQLAGGMSSDQRACVDDAVDDELLRAFFVTALMSQGDPQAYDLDTMADLQAAMGPCLGG